MPRSGHHLLVRILEKLLGSEFGYCERYTVADCCGQIPCRRASCDAAVRLYIQKSHDFELLDPVDSAGALQVIQYRRPIPRLLSDFDSWWSLGGDKSDYSFRKFLADRAVYSVRFYLKWFAESPPHRHYMQYEKLSADPVKSSRTSSPLPE